METFADILPHAFEHAFFDTLALVPFLFVTYLAMEALEHYASEASVAAVRKAGSAGPVIGALLGIVPQCGFSAAAATLYSARVVTLGTLFAVFLSTSDEMLPIMIAAQAPIEFIVEVLAIKAACGLVAGFAIDAVMRLRNRAVEAMRIHDLCERDHCGCEDDEAHERGEAKEDGHGHHEGHGHEHSHGHSHEHSHGIVAIAKSSLVHTLQVTIFVFAVSLVLEIIIDGVGEEALASFIASNEAASVFASALVGLIPNCAASVAITELYLEGALSSGAMIAGLLVSAGVGLLVLFRANRPFAENIAIAFGLVAFGFIFGSAMSMFGVVF